MAQVKLTIEEEGNLSPLAAEKQDVANSPPSAMSEFGQQIAKRNIGRSKLFTWCTILIAFISLSNGHSINREEARSNYGFYSYERNYPNLVLHRAMNMHLALLAISTGSLVFHSIQRRVSKGLDICLSLFSTLVLSIQCGQIMAGKFSVYWDSGTGILSLKFVVWCTFALAILLNTICLYRTVGAMKQVKLCATTSNYAMAHPNCSPLDSAYARFWPIGLQKLAQMLIGAFVLMLAFFGAIGSDDNRIIVSFFGVCTLVWLLQWAFHTARTRCFVVNTSDNKGEESPGLALACFVDCLLSSPGLFFFVVMFKDYSSSHHQTGETRFFTWLSLLCGSMFAGTICYNLLLISRHRKIIGANIVAVWGKLIKQLRNVPRSVPVPLRLSVSVNFTVLIKKDEKEKKAKKINNDADDNKDVEAAAIGDDEVKKAVEKKVEEDGKMKKENGEKKEEDDGNQKKKDEVVKEVVEEKADEEEDGVSFEEIEGEHGEEETAYCIV